jgi:hypothetical protein
MKSRHPGGAADRGASAAMGDPRRRPARMGIVAAASYLGACAGSVASSSRTARRVKEPIDRAVYGQSLHRVMLAVDVEQIASARSAIAGASSMNGG